MRVPVPVFSKVYSVMSARWALAHMLSMWLAKTACAAPYARPACNEGFGVEQKVLSKATYFQHDTARNSPPVISVRLKRASCQMRVN